MIKLLGVVVLAAAAGAVHTGTAQAATVRTVPQQYPTIQQAVNAAVPGDTIRVSPGTYRENVEFAGKALTLVSTGGAAVTTIDGGHLGPVVRIGPLGPGTSVLRGFTIRNGSTLFGGGSGVDTRDGAALIEQNVITGNSTCDGAVDASFSLAVIRDNVITANTGTNCVGGPGVGGVQIGGAGTVALTDNVITGNVSRADGGGILLWAAGAPVISRNVISGNTAGPLGRGGGISMINENRAVVSDNLITGNVDDDGAGIYFTTPADTVGPLIVHNTVVDNVGPAVHADGFDDTAQLGNNIVVASGADPAIVCARFNGQPAAPVLSHNDVVTGTGPRYSGNCGDLTGTAGNISADPGFAGATNFHLKVGSPAVDAGIKAYASRVDLGGTVRPVDGDRNGTAIVDMGAYELTPPAITCTAAPARLSPADHTLRAVTVTVAANAPVRLVSATSSQADARLGTGDVAGDVSGWTAGADDRGGSLRAERFGTTRTYTLTYRATDAGGNTATCAAKVSVP